MCILIFSRPLGNEHPDDLAQKVLRARPGSAAGGRVSVNKEGDRRAAAHAVLQRTLALVHAAVLRIVRLHTDTSSLSGCVIHAALVRETAAAPHARLAG